MNLSSRLFFFLMTLPPPRSTLFPYTTLFRSMYSRIARLSRSASASPATAMTWRVRMNPHAKRSEEHTSELQSLTNLVCRLLLEKKKLRLLFDRLQGEERPSAVAVPAESHRTL